MQCDVRNFGFSCTINLTVNGTDISAAAFNIDRGGMSQSRHFIMNINEGFSLMTFQLFAVAGGVCIAARGSVASNFSLSVFRLKSHYNTSMLETFSGYSSRNNSSPNPLPA